MSLSSCPPHFPLNVLDTHFIARFLIVVEPLSFCQINAGEFSTRFYTDSFPVSLRESVHSSFILQRDLTSGLKSVNSRPLVSISITFFDLAGDVAS